ncbi:MAG: archease [Planctomycetota bacterium]|nr:MAG: archease [Planctomycetota bacterium]
MVWRFIDHTADVLIEVQGQDWPHLLREAVDAFRAYLTGTDSLADEAKESKDDRLVELEITGEEVADLWVRWWRALLRLWTVEEVYPLGVMELSCTDHRLQAKVATRSLEHLDWELCEDVKAVTWHQAEVQQQSDGFWRGTIVLDL